MGGMLDEKKRSNIKTKKLINSLKLKILNQKIIQIKLQKEIIDSDLG